ncbi:MAG: hypothetical protein IT457_10230 [Planctomycetes bacterium]|nr:hypothetical protein [Planctomycetota bacterium]
MRLARPAALVVALAALPGCDRPVEWLRLERVDPRQSGEERPTLALNQSITAYFDAPIDPLSVTAESFRVADSAGRAVRGSLDIGARSVRFRPIPPAGAQLDDGSLLPGGIYRVELAGMPASFALRSRSGRPLDHSLSFSFRVARDPAELGLPTLFLPVGIGDESFSVELGDLGGLRIAADARRFVVRTSLPPLPASLRPEAFQLWRLAPGGSVPERVAIARVSASVPDEVRSASTSTPILLELSTREFIRADDLLYLAFETGENALLDYRGRPLVAPPAPIPVKIDEGDRILVRDLDLAELRFECSSPDALGFEVRDRRIVPRARVEAGSAALGVLRVDDALRIEGGKELLLPGGAEPVSAAAALDFAALEVRAGSELRLRPGVGALLIRVSGDVRIDGRLVLESSARDLPWRAGPAPALDQLARSSGICLVVGGDFVVGENAVVVAEGGETGSPLTLVAGATVRIEGRMPPRVAFALEPQRRILGSVESPIVLQAPLRPGLPAGVRRLAAAATDWLPLPASSGDAIDVVLEDPRGAIRAELQVAPPDVVRPDRPSPEASRWTVPTRLPLQQALAVPRGAWFRVLFEAEVVGDELPSVGGIAVRGN